MDNDAPPSTGLIAGKYELVGIIGRGGMGSVWEGRHSSLGTRVAIKFIESDYADSQEARARFDNEARAAARIQSKHAIQIFDHGVTGDGKPYIVMEFLAGEPLDKRIDRMGRMPLQDAARILGQVCRGLARAHELGIIHRDLKPENIFLVRSPDDDDEVAKVLDFGIAKIKSAPGTGSGGVSSSTKTGAVLGTPFYMSPEQARGLKNVDHRTDIWSLGVIAYKCVTGVLPFEGESVGDLLVKICTAPLVVPSHFLPGLPLAFDAWFARALNRDPERRFATATELADALAFAAGISVRRGGFSSTPEPGGALPYSATAAASAFGSPSRQVGYPPSSSMSAAGYAQPHLPSATSAPFTTSAPHPTQGRGKVVLWSVLLAAVLGTSAFFAVTRFTKRGDGTSSKSVASVSGASSASSAPPAATAAGAGGATAATNDMADAGIAQLPSVPTAKPGHGDPHGGWKPPSPGTKPPPGGKPFNPLPPGPGVTPPAPPTPRPGPVVEPGF